MRDPISKALSHKRMNYISETRIQKLRIVAHIDIAYTRKTHCTHSGTTQQELQKDANYISAVYNSSTTYLSDPKHMKTPQTGMTIRLLLVGLHLWLLCEKYSVTFQKDLDTLSLRTFSGPASGAINVHTIFKISTTPWNFLAAGGH